MMAQFLCNHAEKEEHYSQVFEWYSALPKIFRSFSIFKSDEKEEFVRSLLEGRNYSGEINGKLKCFIHGEIKDTITIEGHLFCEPKLDLDWVCNMVTYAKHEALKEFKYVTTQVITKHPTLHTVMKRSGFLDTGLKSYSQVYKGQLLEVTHYIAGY